MSPDVYSTRPLLDKLGVKPGSRVAVIGVEDRSFLTMLRDRTKDVTVGAPRSACDLVFAGVNRKEDLRVLARAKGWIEPDGGIWLIRPKGPASPLRDTDLIAAGLAAGLVDNKIASFSDSHGAMRFVFRLRDRPR